MECFAGPAAPAAQQQRPLLRGLVRASCPVCARIAPEPAARVRPRKAAATNRREFLARLASPRAPARRIIEFDVDEDALRRRIAELRASRSPPPASGGADRSVSFEGSSTPAEPKAQSSGGDGTRPPRVVALGGSGEEEEEDGAGEGAGEATGSSKGSGALQRFFEAYGRALEARPMVTKGATSAVFFMLSDLFAQLVVERVAAYKPQRTAMMALVGQCLHGPSIHMWYGFLDGTFPGRTPGAVFKKLLLDQTMYAPAAIATFFTVVAIGQGRGPAYIAQKLRQDMPSAMLANWRLWPAAQTANFFLVPPPFRALFLNTVSLVWAVYLAVQASKVADAPAPAPAPDAEDAQPKA
eukprot:tig00000808_g4413.t1